MSLKTDLQNIIISSPNSSWEVTSSGEAHLGPVRMLENESNGTVDIYIDSFLLDEYASPGPAQTKYDNIVSAWNSNAGNRANALIAQAIVELTAILGTIGG